MITENLNAVISVFERQRELIVLLADIVCKIQSQIEKETAVVIKVFRKLSGAVGANACCCAALFSLSGTE